MKLLFTILFCFLSAHLIAALTGVDKTTEAKAWFKNQPLQFVENKGQFTNSDGKPADQVLFKATTGNLDIYITTNGLSYVFFKLEEVPEEKTRTGVKDIMPGRPEKENRKAYYYRMDMNLEGASISKDQVIKELPASQGVTNYFYPHCPDGIYGVQQFGKITIKNIYKGIDWVIYTNTSGEKGQPIKYDFVVQPQANYRDIKIKFVHAQSTTLTDNATKLKIKTIAGTIEEGGLYSYLGNNTDKQPVRSKYTIDKNKLVQFEVDEYDRTKPLVIDPLVWATYYGGQLDDYSNSICTDSQDNLYMTGVSPSTNFPLQQSLGAHWNAGPPVFSDIYILKFNNKGVLLWATFYGANGNTFNSLINVDSQNNIYITGSTYSFNLPTQSVSGSFLQPHQAGMLDLFVIKFNSLGQRQWATYYGGYTDEFAFAIAIDKLDQIYITGSTRSNDFPVYGLSGAYNQPDYAGEKEVFILKFNRNGERLWATFYGGNLDEYSTSIAFDSNNNIYITGLSSSKNFPIQYMANAYNQKDLVGNANVFILKFDHTGKRQWATFYGGSSMDFANSICTDNLDNIYVTGETRSPDFPLQTLPGAFNQTTNIKIFDAYILKFNNKGQRLWCTTFGGNDLDQALSIKADNLNNIYVLGQTLSLDFPTRELSTEYWQPTSRGNQDLFIIMFTEIGRLEWSTYFGGIDYDLASGLAIDKQNYVYCNGTLGKGAYTKDHGDGAYYDDKWNGVIDGFILKFRICNKKRPTSILTDRNNLCIYDNENLTLSAIGGLGDTLKWYSGACGMVNIGKGTSISIPVPPATTTYYARWESTCGTSACDSIVINVYSQVNTPNNTTICEGDTCKVGLSRYTISGSYTDVLKTSAGCDSIVTTNLVVNPLKRITLKPVLCEGDFFTVGNHSYNSPGTYHDTLSTIQCDSIITTQITVNPIAFNSQKFTICQGEIIKIGSHVYTATGYYVDTLETALGCDSIIATTLIVNPTYNITSDKGICEGDFWIVGPHTYTSTGIFTDTLSTINNCDSVITTHLTVHPEQQLIIFPEICSGDSFVIGKHNYQAEGTYSDTLQTVYNCDSIVTTNLRVNPVKSTPIIKSICEGEAFVVGNSTYSSSGLYTNHLSTSSGCDSIVTTNLTVNPLPVINLGNDMIICPGDTIKLTTGPGFISYLWSDGSVLSHLLVTKPGDYSVIVRNEWCPASDEVYIGECGIKLVFPNAFSPDNNATNERFMPVVVGTLKSYLISIYNKWGQLVYESTNAAEGWDGTCKGQLSPIGLYVYSVSYTAGIEPAVTHATVRGSVTLLR